MISDLDSLNPPNQPGRWYMEDAVKAHEYVHVKEWKDTLNPVFSTLKSTVATLSVPHVCGKTRSDAKSDLEALSSYIVAIVNAHGVVAQKWSEVPHESAATEAAERAVVDPMIALIKIKGSSQPNWPAACKFPLRPPGW